MKYINGLILILCLWCRDGYAQGMTFSRYESETVQKTSYSVLEKTLTFQDEFSISFDLALHEYTSLGYILRLRDQKRSDAYTYSFVYYYDNEQWSYLKFNVETQECKAVDTLLNRTLGAKYWIPVKMTFSLRQDSVFLSIAEKQYRMGGLNLPKEMTPSILFGSSKFSEEIPSFSIRNLVVSDTLGRRIEFPLNETSGGQVHDKLGKVWGKAINPVWLLNKSYYWDLLHTQFSETVAGYEYDTREGNFYYFNNDSLYTLDVRHNWWTGKRHRPFPMKVHLGTNFYEPSRQAIYIYEVENRLDSCNICALDVHTGEVTKESDKFLSFQRHHHSTYLDTIQGKYYIFGGFGLRKYTNTLEVYDLREKRWETVSLKGDFISPRFFSSMGALNSEEVLLFGGTGNKSGDQSLGKEYYYDLYRINLKTQTVKKIRDFSYEGVNVVPVRNLILSDDQKAFYTLCYPVQKAYSCLQLYKFSLENDTFEALGDTIPMESQNILSNANLYYNASLKEFYCCIEEFDKSGGTSSLTKFYALSSPPVAESALSVYATDRNYILWGAVIGGILALVAGIIVFSKKKKTKEESEDSAPKLPASDKQVISPSEEKKGVSANALYLFGEFTVLDRKRRDISYLFSGKIRQLFLLALLNSVGQDAKGGITSSYMYGLLWPEKEFSSAKNLKGVTINRLRKILEDLDGIELVYVNNRYLIQFTGDFYCDYLQYREQIEKITQSDVSFREMERPLIEVLLRGKFLKSVEDAMFDDFKNKQEDELHGILIMELGRLYAKADFEQVIQLAGIWLQVDSLSDMALWYMLNASHRLKKEDQAMKKYYLYIAEYSKTTGQPYSYSYSDMIQNDLRSAFQ